MNEESAKAYVLRSIHNWLGKQAMLASRRPVIPVDSLTRVWTFPRRATWGRYYPAEQESECCWIWNCWPPPKVCVREIELDD